MRFWNYNKAPEDAFRFVKLKSKTQAYTLHPTPCTPHQAPYIQHPISKIKAPRKAYSASKKSICANVEGTDHQDLNRCVGRLVCRGVRLVHISVDGIPATPTSGVVVRKAPGGTPFDYGHTIGVSPHSP